MKIRTLLLGLFTTCLSNAQFACYQQAEDTFRTWYPYELKDAAVNPATVRSIYISSPDDSVLLENLDRYWNVSRLSINLSNRHKKLPSFVYKLWKLRTLSLSDVDSLDENVFFTRIRNVRSLRVLNISYCRRTFVIPDEIQFMTELESLGFSYVHMPLLNPLVSKMHDLKSLSLESCGLNALPGELEQLKRLEHLSLALIKEGESNNFKAMPQFIFSLPSLKSLNMFATGLEKIPEQVRGLKLECLSIGGNPLLDKNDESRLSELLRMLSSLPLRNLDLSMMPVSRLPGEIALLRNLEYLDLYYTGITDIDAAISTLPKLKGLDITYNNMTVEKQFALSVLLPACKIYGYYKHQR